MSAQQHCNAKMPVKKACQDKYADQKALPSTLTHLNPGM